MNSGALAANSLQPALLEPIDALRAALSLVLARVGDPSAVDEPIAAHQNHNHNHPPHNLHNMHHIQAGNHAQNQFHGYSQPQQPQQPQMLPFQETQLKLTDTMAKIENEVTLMGQDLSYFRHVLDFQNSKIEKLTLLLIDLLHNKDVTQIVNLLQNIQQSDPFNVDDTHDSVDDSLPDSVHDPVHDVLHQIPLPSPVVPVSAVGVLLDTNMDPQLHQVVAQAAVQAQNKGDKKMRKRSFPKPGKVHPLHRKPPNPEPEPQQPNHVQQALRLLQQQQPKPAQIAHQDLLLLVLLVSLTRKESISGVSMPGLEVVNMDALLGRKKPKVLVDFLHNPMTVKEIYNEYTRGFRGQPPLREMDERFGKHEWRGDSRSKESKRFQRRKKLCDAIERGMEKYGKSADEIVSYIEEFRANKSLTWVMNGNLPRDLME